VAKIEPSDLIDSDEIAVLIGLSSRNAVRVYRGRYVDFPEPVVKKGRCLLWLRSDVERWAKVHGRR
jgi:predicted DNA-binding transcriptional regulator AlpA